MPKQQNTTNSYGIVQKNKELLAEIFGDQKETAAYLASLATGDHWMFSALNNARIFSVSQLNGNNAAGELRPMTKADAESIRTSIPSWNEVGGKVVLPRDEEGNIKVRGIPLVIPSAVDGPDGKPSFSVTYFYPADLAEPSHDSDKRWINRHKFIGEHLGPEKWEQVKESVGFNELPVLAQYALSLRYGQAEEAKGYLETILAAPALASVSAADELVSNVDTIRRSIGSAIGNIESQLGKERIAAYRERMAEQKQQEQPAQAEPLTEAPVQEQAVAQIPQQEVPGMESSADLRAASVQELAQLMASAMPKPSDTQSLGY